MAVFGQPSTQERQALQRVSQMFETVIEPDVIKLRRWFERTDFAGDHGPSELMSAELGVTEVGLDAGHFLVESRHQVEEFAAAATGVENGSRVPEEIAVGKDVSGGAGEVADGVLELGEENLLLDLAVMMRVEVRKILLGGDGMVVHEAAAAAHHDFQRPAVAVFGFDEEAASGLAQGTRLLFC